MTKIQNYHCAKSNYALKGSYDTQRTPQQINTEEINPKINLLPSKEGRTPRLHYLSHPEKSSIVNSV